MSKFIKILKYLIGWPLTLISLALIFKVIFSNSNILTQITSFNPLIFILSIFVFLLYFIFRSLVWKEMLDTKGHKLSVKETFFIWSSTEIKRYVPGNIWSFISRAENYKDRGVERKAVFSSVFLEIELIILSCSIISLSALSYVLENVFLRTGIYFLVLSATFLFLFINGFQNRFAVENKFLKILLPAIPIITKLKLFLLSFISFSLFGIATYLAGLSIIYLNPYYLEGYVGFFAFSLLVGYISFVTPMGLGVREGVMALSLSKFMSIQSAGIFSLFSRIVFIISELIFLTLSYLWYKIKSEFFLKIEKTIKNNKYKIALLVCIFIYVAYFTTASFLRYDNFYTGRFDLGNMDQTVWNSIHGRLFQTTDPNGTDIISRLSFHADFILVLISPLYLIWSNPKMLLLLQTVILSLGAVFIYLISKRITKNQSISFVLSAAFLLNPSVQYSNLYDFHPVALATTFLLATFYFFSSRKYFLFLIFAILSGLTKEHVWAIISLFGIAISARVASENKSKLKILNKNNLIEIIFGLFVFLTSAFLFYYLIWQAIPNARGGNHFALSYYSDFGGSATDILRNILIDPIKTFSIILNLEKLLYIFQLLFPLGFTSLFSPVILVFLVPDLAINLLSNNTQLHQIYYQYTATITPFVFISSVYSVKFLTLRFKRISYSFLCLFILATSLISLYFLGPLVGTSKPNINMFSKPLPNKEAVEKFISSIPTRYSIAATNNIGSHLSRRQKIYTIPVGIDKADVILFLLNDPFAQPSLQAQKLIVEQMRNDKNYVQVYKDGDFIAFEKRTLYTEPKPKPKKGQVKLFPYSITALSNRSYQKSEIKIERQVSSNGNFKSFVISFTSDGLKEYALMNIPNSQKPEKGFPVLVLNHGYIQPKTYDTVNSYKTDSDYFANQGFLILKPDYRGNGNSEVADRALMRFAYPIDVLNLIASVENIPEADKNQIFLWSHSMGGEVALEVLEVASKNDDFLSKIKGAAFWAPVTDPAKWFSKQNLPNLPESRQSPFPYAQTFKILGTPDENPELWQSLSPLNYLSNINVPVLLQHGTADTTVPCAWSAELYNKLQKLNKNVNFVSYPNDTHNLPLHWLEAVSSDSKFFKSLQN